MKTLGKALGKTFAVLLILVSGCFAQSSSSGNFSVRHLRKPNFALAAPDLHEAEKLYQSACIIVRRVMPQSPLHPQFTVVLGNAKDEVEGHEIRLTKWNPVAFVEGVVIVAADRRLDPDMIQQLTRRAIQYNNAMVDVSELLQGR